MYVYSYCKVYPTLYTSNYVFLSKTWAVQLSNAEAVNYLKKILSQTYLYMFALGDEKPSLLCSSVVDWVNMLGAENWDCFFFFFQTFARRMDSNARERESGTPIMRSCLAGVCVCTQKPGGKVSVCI